MDSRRLKAEEEIAIALAQICCHSGRGDVPMLEHVLWQKYAPIVNKYEREFPGIKKAFDAGLKRVVSDSDLGSYAIE